MFRGRRYSSWSECSESIVLGMYTRFITNLSWRSTIWRVNVGSSTSLSILLGFLSQTSNKTINISSWNWWFCNWKQISMSSICLLFKIWKTTNSFLKFSSLFLKIFWGVGSKSLMKCTIPAERLKISSLTKWNSFLDYTMSKTLQICPRSINHFQSSQSSKSPSLISHPRSTICQRYILQSSSGGTSRKWKNSQILNNFSSSTKMSLRESESSGRFKKNKKIWIDKSRQPLKK